MDHDTEEDPTATRFADALADLKQRGSTLLLTGIDSTAREAACRRLLGDAGVASRKRLFVHAGGERTTDLPSAGGESRHVTYPTATRSTTASAGSAAGPLPDRVVDGDLPALRRAIEEEMAALADPGMAPGTLRSCIGNADAIVAAHDLERAFALFQGLGALAEEHGAMIHAHLPNRFDDETTQTLIPLFDAVVEVREGPHQRWHLRDQDLTTDWLAL
jgi:hypothetical protein